MFCYNCMNQIDDNVAFCPYCGCSTEPVTIAHHLKPGTVLHEKYLVGKCLGEGGFGITYIGRDLTLDMKIAIKEFYPSGYANRNSTVTNTVTLNYSKEGEYFKRGKENFLKEAKSIAMFAGENSIVDVRDFFTENDTAYIIMEYLDGVTLSKKIKTEGLYDPVKLFTLMLPIMSSLDKMHRSGIIHRDISPDNIMLLKENGCLKLMDFGAARFFSNGEQKTMSVMLKPGYAPYEQHSRTGNQGPWTDVYGLCATIYKCITGITPTDSLDRCQNDDLKPPSQLGVRISPALESVLMYGLAIYPDNRCPSMGKLLDLSIRALNNQTVSGTTGESRTEKTVREIKDRDSMYKTQFENNGFSNTNNQYSDYQNNTQTQLPKKSYTGLIIALIAATVVIVAAIGIVTAVILTSGGSDSGDTQSSSARATSDVSDYDDHSQAEVTTADVSVTVADVTGKRYDEAKKALENLGLSVEIEWEESDKAKKDYVVSQIPGADSSAKKGDTVTLFVSKGKSNTEVYDQKLVVTASSGSSYATMVLYNWDDGEWISKFKCDATVGKGGISTNNSESNTLTPKGSFPLGTVLSASHQDTNMNQYTVSSSTVVCDDTAYPSYYNQIMDSGSLPSGASSDPIGKKLLNGENNALIFIEHNGNGFSSSGVSTGNSSVITVCGCKSGISPTYGCIDISSSNMTKLLKLLDSEKNPYIITEVK